MIRKGKEQQNSVPISRPAEIKTGSAFHKEVDRVLRVFDQVAAKEKRRKQIST